MGLSPSTSREARSVYPTVDWKTYLLHFFQQLHDGNHVAEHYDMVLVYVDNILVFA